MIVAANKVNPTKYGQLLAETLPAPIRSEAEYRRALKAVEGLMTKQSKRTREETLLLDLLATLIEIYEDEHYPIPDAPGHEILQFLLEDRGLKQSDLVPVFGSSGIVSELVNGKRPIGMNVARKLGKFFDINPEVFLSLDSPKE